MENFVSGTGVPHYPEVRVIDVATMELGGQRFLNPYLAAEHIPKKAINSIPPPSNAQQKIWRTIDCGIACNDARMVYRARDQLEHLAHEARTGTSRARADMVLANIGLLALRANRATPSGTDVQNSYRAMAAVTRRTLDGEYGALDTAHYKGILSEQIAYCLLARPGHRGYTPYLGSTREESSRLQKDNHDLYTLYAGLSKVAVQVKHRGPKRQVPPTFTSRLYVKDHILDNIVPDEEDTAINFVAEMIAVEATTSHSRGSQGDFMLSKLSLDTMGLVSNHMSYLQSNPVYQNFPYRPYLNRGSGA